MKSEYIYSLYPHIKIRRTWYHGCARHHFLSWQKDHRCRPTKVSQVYVRKHYKISYKNWALSLCLHLVYAVINFTTKRNKYNRFWRVTVPKWHIMSCCTYDFILFLFGKSNYSGIWIIILLKTFTWTLFLSVHYQTENVTLKCFRYL